MREIQIYFKDGRVFTYSINSQISSCREHANKILHDGFRDWRNGKMTYYGSHYIDKIVFDMPKEDSDYLLLKYEYNQSCNVK